MATAHPFSEQAVRSRSWFQRLLGTHPRENAILAIQNCLARADSLRDVTPSEILDAAAEHGVETLTVFDAELRGIFEKHLAHCLEDQALTEEEIEDLAAIPSSGGRPNSSFDTVPLTSMVQ
ncbi:MAG: hypothetical protein IT169_18050 [Bryobacterales bacterium]|nr:hypothetical protein [Bryobacterales bacterium]